MIGSQAGPGDGRGAFDDQGKLTLFFSDTPAMAGDQQNIECDDLLQEHNLIQVFSNLVAQETFVLQSEGLNARKKLFSEMNTTLQHILSGIGMAKRRIIAPRINQVIHSTSHESGCFCPFAIDHVAERPVSRSRIFQSGDIWSDFRFSCPSFPFRPLTFPFCLFPRYDHVFPFLTLTKETSFTISSGLLTISR